MEGKGKDRGGGKKRHQMGEEAWKEMRLVRKIGTRSIKGLLNRVKAFELFPEGNRKTNQSILYSRPAL